MVNIAIIGAGQLGSRHLQALNLVQEPLSITVIDPSQESLNIAKLRFEDVKAKTTHAIGYQQSMDLPTKLDIAIVASTAMGRLEIMQKLLSKSDVAHLVLEKILFTKQQDYFKAEELLAGKATKVWVNCCMRMMPFYNQFAATFQGKAIQYRVEGSQYGLVTNAIHYLDHVVHLTGCQEFELDLRYLDKAVIASKRPGYFELTGTLMARFANGSLAIIHSNKQGSSPIQIEIYDHENRVISRESQHKAWITSAKQDWHWTEQDAPIPFQSQLTADLVNGLIKTGQSELPDYQASKAVHLQLLEPLKEFLQEQGLQSEIEYPFT